MDMILEILVAVAIFFKLLCVVSVLAVIGLFAGVKMLLLWITKGGSVFNDGL